MNMKRTATIDRTHFSSRIRTDLLDRVDREAQRRMVSRSYIIEASVERFLEAEEGKS